MIREILIQKEQQLQQNGYLEFDQQELSVMDAETAGKIMDHFHGVALMRLPQVEIDFFEWLKNEDSDVWDDLWADEENTYLVSIDLLSCFVADANGFPICDLINQPNYWFSPKHIKPKGNEKFPLIEEKLDADKNLTVDEALLLEIMQSALDIWHFCYKYNYPVQKAKQIVRAMHREDLLVHLPEREDLVKYIEM
jgi:hypothetical protein